MTVIEDIFLSMIPYLLITIPFIMISRLLIYKIYKKKCIESTVLREILVWVFILYVVGIISQTLLPRIILTDNGLLFQSYEYSSVNFEFFRVFRLVHRVGAYAFIRYFLCNMLMMVPISLFSCLLYNGAKAYRGIFIGFSGSVLIEFVQIFVGRCFDVDDIILNTTGAVIGAMIYMLLVRFVPEFIQKCRLQRKEG